MHRGSGDIKGSMASKGLSVMIKKGNKSRVERQREGEMSHAWGQRMTSVGEICEVRLSI